MKDGYTHTCVDRPFVPERDLFRLLKYGTYDLLTLYALTPEDVPENELTEEELKLVKYWYDNHQLERWEYIHGKNEL